MSHDITELVSKLKETLFYKEGSFRKIVVVPNKLIKNKLYDQLLDRKVVTGFKVLELSSAIEYLTQLIVFENVPKRVFPSFRMISLHLESLIEGYIRENNQEFLSCFSSVKLDEKRKVKEWTEDLSEELAQEFMHYGLYGGEGLEQWLQHPGWQKDLWEKLFLHWEYPYRLLQCPLSNPLNLEMEIHVFGFSFIPKVYDLFFQKLSLFFPFYEYYLSPSRVFWGDLCSERERFFLKQWHEKRGVKEEEILQLDEYLQSRNVLLATFGKQTQKRYNTLLDREYVLEERFSYESCRERTLLQTLKEDLLEGRSLEREDSLPLQEEDFSVQVHEAPSKKREVETLLASLMNLTSHYEIKPSEILVLAPNIAEYFPFIYQIFKMDSPFSIEVHDLEILCQSQFLQGFLHVLCLQELRWEQKDIFKLFTLEPFLKKAGIEREEVNTLKRWSDAAHITWGYHKRHREAKLGIADTKEAGVEACEAGTWKYALERLLFGLVNMQEGSQEKGVVDYFPLQGVEMAQARLLGKFIDMIDQLYETMTQLSEKEHTLEEWVDLFKHIADQYFLVESSQEERGRDVFTDQLKMLLQLSSKLPDYHYAFSSMKKVFEKAFNKKVGIYSESNQEAICFASIQSQQLYPVKVVCLLGMDEDAFPRKMKASPLRDIEENKMDFCPKNIEEDRQILLDVCLYAQESVIFSYCCADPIDGKEKKPSFLVEELLEYCDSQYRYLPSQRKPSEKIFYTHKEFAFHAHELSQNNPFLCFSPRVYELAKRYYHIEKKVTQFIPEFYPSLEKPLLKLSETKEHTIGISDLKTFARNPFQHYFNERLGVYLNSEESSLEKLSKEFILSPLDKARFRIESLQQEFVSEYETWELLGKLPLGVFQDIARDQLEEQQQLLLEHFSLFGVNVADLETFELSSSCKKPLKRDAKHWVLPSLKVSTTQQDIFYIEGILEGISEKGLLFYGKDSFQEMFKIWPIYLLFCAVSARDFPERNTSLLCVKEGKVKSYDQGKAVEDLGSYLNYYKKALETPSPLDPPWSEAMLIKSKEDSAKLIKKSFKESHILQMHTGDIYQKWLFEHLEPICPDTLQELWQGELVKALNPLAIWCGKGEVNHG